MYGEPVLKFRSRDKLHISKKPGFVSWATAATITSVGIIFVIFVIPDGLASAGCLLMCLVVGLTMMEPWEDFVIDREEDLVTFVTRSWYHELSMCVPEENVIRFPLNIIRAVVMHPVSGIQLIKKDGSYATLAPTTKSSLRLKILRREISTFLQQEWMEELSCYDRMVCETSESPFTWDWQDLREDHESDTETQDSDTTNHSVVQYGRNIKIISGPSS